MQTIKSALYCSVILFAMTSQAFAVDCESEVKSAENSVASAKAAIKTVEKVFNRARIRVFLDDADMYLSSAKFLCKRPKATSHTRARAMARALMASGHAKAAEALVEDYKNMKTLTP